MQYGKRNETTSRGRSALSILLSAGLLGTGGCGGSGPGAGDGKKLELVVYTSAVEDSMRPQVEMFKKWVREQHGKDVEVNWIYAATSSNYARMEAEKENPQADIVDTSCEQAYIAKEKGLTEPYRISRWEELPAAAKDKDGHWWAPGFGVYGIVYNKDLVSDAEAPRDWVDVLDPKWKGQVIARDPTQSGTGGTIMLAFMAVWGPEMGKDFLLRLDNQVGGRYQENSTKTVLDVARGASKMALWNESYTLQLKYDKGFSNLGLVYPKSWVAVGRGSLLIPKGAPHRETAHLWMEFISSPVMALHSLRHYGRPVLTAGLRDEDMPEWTRTYPTEKLPTADIAWERLADVRAEWLHVWDTQVKGRGATYVAAHPAIPEYKMISDYMRKE